MRDFNLKNIGWGILGFVIPILGAILFLFWKNDAAKAAGIGALISICAIAYFSLK